MATVVAITFVKRPGLEVILYVFVGAPRTSSSRRTDPWTARPMDAQLTHGHLRTVHNGTGVSCTEGNKAFPGDPY